MVRSAIRPFALVLMTVLLFGAVHCFGAVTREYAQVYPLQSGGSLDLTNVNGTVRIEAWDKDVVEVRAVKTAPQKESDLDRVSIDVDSKPGSLSISTRYPQEEGVDVAVDYTIHVPRRAQVARVNTVNGSLSVTNLETVGDLQTVNGNIQVFDGSGNVHARTTNGNVYLELKHPADGKGAVAETTNGSVMLAIPSDLPANLEAKCMNGSFSSELPVVMEGATHPRVLHGRLGQGGAPIHLGTVNGTIRIVALRSTI
jgi:DUF4097 and DUF4098 domain-containing protein YvlB